MLRGCDGLAHLKSHKSHSIQVDLPHLHLLVLSAVSVHTCHRPDLLVVSGLSPSRFRANFRLHNPSTARSYGGSSSSRPSTFFYHYHYGHRSDPQHRSVASTAHRPRPPRPFQVPPNLVRLGRISQAGLGRVRPTGRLTRQQSLNPWLNPWRGGHCEGNPRRSDSASESLFPTCVFCSIECFVCFIVRKYPCYVLKTGMCHVTVACCFGLQDILPRFYSSAFPPLQMACVNS